MEEQSPNRILVVVAVLSTVMVIVVLTGFLYLTFKPTSSTPLVTIHSPAQGIQVGVGDLIAVNSTARDEKNEITKVELWETVAGSTRLVGVSENIEPVGVFSVPQDWQPFSSGAYRLTVRAFNDQGDFGQAAMDFQVIELPEEIEEAASEEGNGTKDEVKEKVDEKETQSTISGFYDVVTVPEDTSAPLGLVFLPDMPIPDFSNIVFRNLGDIFTYGHPILNSIEVEALEFEVFQDYARVMCYASFASLPTQRVPESGFFDTTSEYHWNIEDHLGGSNSVVIPIPIDQDLDITLTCYGSRIKDQYLFMGTLDATHPPADWNGQIQTGFGFRGEGFNVRYRINPFGMDLETPFPLSEISWSQHKFLHWDWNGEVDEIDAFRIYRDYDQVASVSPVARIFQMPEWWTVPPCGEEYAYKVTAYRGLVESPPSNALVYQGESCSGENMISSIRTIDVDPCNGIGRRFFIGYKYLSSHGQASIGIRLFKDDKLVGQFFTGHPHIQHGGGVAVVTMTYNGSEPITTNKISVFLQDANGQDFYVENFNQVIEWQPGIPDLRIASARVNKDNHFLRVNLRNSGCAGYHDETPLLAINRDADGWNGFEDMHETFPPRSGKSLTIDFPAEDTNLWSGAITLTVDSTNVIEESNEGNNVYQIDEARVKSVRFYKIGIHDNKEPWLRRPGEFEFRFKYGYGSGPDDTEWNVLERNYQFNKGTYEINVEFFPNLGSNDDLRIEVSGIENDTHEFNASDIVGWFTRMHSHDLFTEGTWKTGGEFSATSSTGDYTVYYRIILE